MGEAVRPFDPNYCPTCGGRYVSLCRCMLADRRCTRGHHWHRCKVHGIVARKGKHGARRADGCSCEGVEADLGANI